jgi:hypothetical protein
LSDENLDSLRLIPFILGAGKTMPDPKKNLQNPHPIQVKMLEKIFRFGNRYNIQEGPVR